MKKVMSIVWLLSIILVCCKKEDQVAVPASTSDSVQVAARTNVKQLGVITNSPNCQSAHIQSLIASNKTLYFPKGTYVIETPINISGVNNLNIIGDEGTVFKTMGNKIFNIYGSVSKLEIKNIKFVSTNVSTIEDPEGLISIWSYGDNDLMDGIKIWYCKFTIPNSPANGIKLISEGSNSLIKNVSVINNRFESIGRMAVEFQNHNTRTMKARYSNYNISNNYFYDIGTIQLYQAACCVSVSGYSLNGKINNNTMIDMRMDKTPYVYYGIENAGTCNLETIGNRIKATVYGFTGILGSNPSVVKTNWVIKDNVIELTGSNPDKVRIRAMELSYVSDYTITNNTMNTDGYALRFIDCKNGVITNNKAISRTGFVVDFEAGSAKNTISLNSFTSKGPDSPVVIFNGATTRGNVAYQNVLTKANNLPGCYLDVNGASNDTK